MGQLWNFAQIQEKHGFYSLINPQLLNARVKNKTNSGRETVHDTRSENKTGGKTNEKSI